MIESVKQGISYKFCHSGFVETEILILCDEGYHVADKEVDVTMQKATAGLPPEISHIFTRGAEPDALHQTILR